MAKKRTKEKDQITVLVVCKDVTTLSPFGRRVPLPHPIRHPSPFFVVCLLVISFFFSFWLLLSPFLTLFCLFSPSTAPSPLSFFFSSSPSLSSDPKRKRRHTQSLVLLVSFVFPHSLWSAERRAIHNEGERRDCVWRSSTTLREKIPSVRL